MKTAIILCVPDGYANSTKPKQLKEFLGRHDYDTEIYSTIMLSRMAEYGWKKFIPYPSIDCIKLYFLEILSFAANKQSSRAFKKAINALVIQRMCQVRGKILKAKLAGRDLDLLIAENNFDEAVMFYRLARVQIMDSPTPLAEELFYGGEIDEKFYERFKAFEKTVYAAADHLSFHWYTYAEFVKKYKYDGKNIIDLSFATTPQPKRAHYSDKPKVVFLGFLGGYWINRPLLKKLSVLYQIDVYGGPRIPGIDLNYKGYSSNADILTDYQFGLITITDDPLRRMGFSAKNVEYFRYGLPALVPEWRHDVRLAPGSIFYNEQNFVSVIKEYTNREKWLEKSNAAIAIADALNFENAFQPLKEIISK